MFVNPQPTLLRTVTNPIVYYFNLYNIKYCFLVAKFLHYLIKFSCQLHYHKLMKDLIYFIRIHLTIFINLGSAAYTFINPI